MVETHNYNGEYRNYKHAEKMISLLADYTCSSFKPSVFSLSIDGSWSIRAKIFSAEAAALEASGVKLLASPIAIAPKTIAENTLKRAR